MSPGVSRHSDVAEEQGVTFGVDYAYGSPNPATLKKAGVKFVCRYLSTPGNTKNLTRAEAAMLRAAGINVVVVFEKSANRALSGKNAGAEDARSALSQATAVGMPHGSPIYFAVDFDANPAQQTAINAYLTGAVSVLGKSCVGVYGSYYVCKRALEAGVIDRAWQTYAWSGGLLYVLKIIASKPGIGKIRHPSAQIYQYRNGKTLAGISVDFDNAYAADYGQWRTSGPVLKPPQPAPKPALKRLGGNIFKFWNPMKGKFWRSG